MIATASPSAAGALRLRGGDSLKVVTDVSAGLQILGGAYNYAYPADAIYAFGYDKALPVSSQDAAMMRYLATQQGTGRRGKTRRNSMINIQKWAAASAK